MLEVRVLISQRSNARLLIHLEPRHAATAIPHIPHPTPGAPGPQGPHLAIVQVLHGSQDKPGPLGNPATHNVSSCISLFSRWSSYGFLDWVMFEVEWRYLESLFCIHSHFEFRFVRFHRMQYDKKLVLFASEWKQATKTKESDSSKQQILNYYSITTYL